MILQKATGADLLMWWLLYGFMSHPFAKGEDWTTEARKALFYAYEDWMFSNAHHHDEALRYRLMELYEEAKAEYLASV